MTDRSSRTRRRWLSTCAGVAGATALAGCFGSDERGIEDDEDASTDGAGSDENSLGSDWPMYGVDLQNTAHHPDAVGPDGDDLTKRALIDLGGLSIHPVAIVDGTVYVPSTNGKTYAVDPDQEEIVWEGTGHGAPVVHDGMVYGPTDSGQVYGYDVDTGDEWVPEEIESDSGLTAPTPTKERLLIASGETIWEIDFNSGEYVDIINTPQFIGRSTYVPAYNDGMYYIGRSSVLYGINVKTPEIEWTFETKNEAILSDSNPVVSNGIVYVTSYDRQLHAVDADSGGELWAVDTNRRIESSPAVGDGLVYTGDITQVTAIGAENGEIEWQADDAIMGEPEDIVVADGVCYVTTRNGISAYDAASGDLEWEYDVSDDDDVRFNAPPAISDGTIYLPSRDETLYAIEDA